MWLNTGLIRPTPGRYREAAGMDPYRGRTVTLILAFPPVFRSDDEDTGGGTYLALILGELVRTLP